MMAVMPTWLVVTVVIVAVLVAIGIGWYVYCRCPRCGALSFTNQGFPDPPPKDENEPRQVLMRCAACGFEKRYPVGGGSDGGGGGDGDGGGD